MTYWSQYYPPVLLEVTNTMYHILYVKKLVKHNAKLFIAVFLLFQACLKFRPTASYHLAVSVILLSNYFGAADINETL